MFAQIGTAGSQTNQADSNKPNAIHQNQGITAYTMFGAILRRIIFFIYDYMKQKQRVIVYIGSLRSCLKFFQKFFVASFRHVFAIFIVK